MNVNLQSLREIQSLESSLDNHIDKNSEDALNKYKETLADLLGICLCGDFDEFLIYLHTGLSFIDEKSKCRDNHQDTKSIDQAEAEFHGSHLNYLFFMRTLSTNDIIHHTEVTNFWFLTTEGSKVLSLLSEYLTLRNTVIKPDPQVNKNP